MATRFQISLTGSEVARLTELVSKGRESARVIRRANILLQLNRGLTRAVISEVIGAGVATVGRVKRNYRDFGIDGALYEETRAGRPVVYGERARKRIIALACTEPPAGHTNWTLKLLAEHSGLSPQPSRSKVCLILREDGIKPWREKNVVRSESR